MTSQKSSVFLIGRLIFLSKNKKSTAFSPYSNESHTELTDAICILLGNRDIT